MQIKIQLKKFFAGEKNLENEFEILQALNTCDETEKNVVIERFTGGNFITAQFKLFISKATYYRKLRKFIKRLESLILKKNDTF